MSGWRVERTSNGRVVLIHAADQAVFYQDDLDPGEAWDLGDDLTIAAEQIWSKRGKWQPVQVDLPPWADLRVVRWGAMTLLTCPCNLDINVDDMTLGEMINAAREHWQASHTSDLGPDADVISTDMDVAQYAQREDENADTDPAVPEAKVQPETLGDAHGGGDQVQDDSQHQRWVLPGDVR